MTSSFSTKTNRDFFLSILVGSTQSKAPLVVAAPFGRRRRVVATLVTQHFNKPANVPVHTLHTFTHTYRAPRSWHT